LGFSLEVQLIEDLNPGFKVLCKDPQKSLALFCMHLISEKNHVVPKSLRRFWNYQKRALRNPDSGTQVQIALSISGASRFVIELDGCVAAQVILLWVHSKFYEKGFP